MQVTIKYNDEHSLTKEEIVRQTLTNYGKAAIVEIMPDSTNAHDLIYFGLQQIMVHKQLSMLYDDKHEYQNNLKKLRAETLYKLQEIVDQVLIDTESKVAA